MWYTKASLKELKDVARTLKDAASNVAYHMGRNSVTHTARSAQSTIRQLAFVMWHCETPRKFAKRFDVNMMQAQKGPVEIEVRDGGRSIFISGHFDTETLRKFFVLNDPTDIIVIQPDKGE
jgi:hypothetical protein